MKNKQIFFFVLFINTSCLLFKKEIKQPVNLVVDDRSLSVEFSMLSAGQKYLGNCNDNSIVVNFYKGFNEELNRTNNVTVRFNGNVENTNYVLVLKKIIAEERDVYRNVKDGDVEINGIVLVEFTMRVFAEFRVKGKVEKIYAINIMESKEEKYSNKMGLGDYDYGISKDGKQYRYKRLNDYICNESAEKLGGRIWVPITRKIAKNQK
jgi:hypothetical protein